MARLGWNVSSITKLYGTADAVTASFTYEPYFNQVATVTDPLNHTWTIGFDAAHNPVTLTDPLNHVTTKAYNFAGQVTSVTDANNHTTTFTYSGADLISSQDALGRVTRFSFDSAGRLVYVTDPAGQLTQLEYDGRDHLTKRTEPNGNTVQLAYDDAGRLSGHRDQNNNLTSYGYGSLGLQTSRTDALTHAETFDYDVAGKLFQITDRMGQVSGLSYDNRNRLNQVGFGATVANPTAYTSTIGYTFDAGDRITQIADSANGTISRTFDGLDRLTQEQTAEGTVSYTFDAAGRRATMTVAGQAQVTYTWDNANRLTQIAQGTDVIGFAYDSADRRTSTTLANGVVMSYGFDDANELTSITYTNGVTTLGDLQYTYDAAGRRINVGGTFARTNLPAAIASATYNANNQLTSWPGMTPSYDLNGNMTGDGASTYGWNARGELASISGAASASFAYDGTGRRKSKTIGSAQTGLLYDGPNFVQELSGTTATANLITGGIDEVFLRRDASASHFMNDALGSVIALSDSSGTMQTQYTFEPYGKASRSGSPSANSQSYTGREDDGTGLMYYRARYYAPNFGRFISQDPIEFRGGSNLYAYVGADPITFSDPSGLLFGINAGESYGAAAAQYWADKQTQTGNGLYAIPGAFASLWTPCTSNKTFGTLLLAYGAGWAPKVLPNFPEWFQNPFWYEVGQKTIPTALYESMSGLSAAARGKAIVDQLGWLGTITPSYGPWGITFGAGPTPGGWLGVIGAGAASIIGGSDCDCK